MIDIIKMENFNCNLCNRTIPELNDFYDYIEKNNKEEWHNCRMGQSIDYIYKHIKDAFNKTSRCIILDVGDYEYVFTKALKDVLNCEILNTKGDLRYPIDSNIFNNSEIDIILLMEVIEHLPDINTENNTSGEVFKYSGMKGLLSNLTQYMNKDTLLFITTPNLCSYGAIFRVINNLHPYTWTEHPKELTIDEVNMLCEGVNLKIVKYNTYRSWIWYSENDLNLIKNLIDQMGVKDTYKEDNIFHISKLNI